jgi:hypothetical protein
MPIDYTGFGFPKDAKHPAQPKTRKQERKTDNGRAERAASADKLKVKARQHQVCFGWGVNPHCQKTIWDAHELISQAQGGPRESWNRVGLCRRCHREAQGRVGGNRLLFDWVGKQAGAKPNANLPNNVTCRWRDDARGPEQGISGHPAARRLPGGRAGGRQRPSSQ